MKHREIALSFLVGVMATLLVGGAAGDSSRLMGGLFSTTLPTLTSNNSKNALQLDSRSRLIVNASDTALIGSMEIINPVGAGTEAAALRVTVATDSTGILQVDGPIAEGAGAGTPILIAARDPSGNVLSPQVDSDRRALSVTESTQAQWTDSAGVETAINFASGSTLTNSQELVAADAGNRHVILEFFVSPDTATTLQLRQGSGGTAIGPILNVPADVGAYYPREGLREIQSALESADGGNVWLDVGTAQTAGGWHLIYTTRD